MNNLLFKTFQTIPLILLLVIGAPTHASNSYIPPQAFTYKDIIKSELDLFFPDIPEYNYVPALIEHESCLSLRHSRCWSSTSELKSAREHGVGLGMVTRAFNANGGTRFDTLANLKNTYRTHLREANWSTIKDRPDLQIRMIALLLMENWRSFHTVSDPMARLHMTDAAYNAGVGNIQKERRACGLAAGCDPNYWMLNTENYCLRSKRVLYGNRSACDITKHHTRDVFENRLPKYQEQYFN